MTTKSDNILYKVVEKKTRFGSNWAIFASNLKRFSYDPAHRDAYKEGLAFRKKHPQLFPRYLKGHIIEALKDTIGLMLFNDSYDALEFQAHHRLDENTKVIRVEPLSKVNKIPKRFSVVSNCGGDVKNLEYAYMAGREENAMSGPDNIRIYKLKYPKYHGIVLCYKIMVLE